MNEWCRKFNTQLQNLILSLRRPLPDDAEYGIKLFLPYLEDQGNTFHSIHDKFFTMVNMIHLGCTFILYHTGTEFTYLM